MTLLADTNRDAAAAACQRLAVKWGHQPWSDSWARLVAETALGAVGEPNPSEWLLSRATYATALGQSTLRMHMENGDLPGLLRQLAADWEKQR